MWKIILTCFKGDLYLSSYLVSSPWSSSYSSSPYSHLHHHHHHKYHHLHLYHPNYDQPHPPFDLYHLKENKSAFRFYTSLGYDIDRNSPSKYGTHYSILSFHILIFLNFPPISWLHYSLNILNCRHYAELTITL